MKRNTFPKLFAIAALSSVVATAGRPIAAETSAPVAADNTKMNEGDQHAGAPTADHAKQNVTDRELMSQIRKSVVQDDTLSTYAHNVKIIAQNGIVTLKGPVRSALEKETLVAKAVAIAGQENVRDQITVKVKTN